MIHTRVACSAVSDGGNSTECTGFTRWTDWTNQKAVSLGYGGGFLAHGNVAKILRKKMLALCHDNRSSPSPSEMSLYPSSFIPLSASSPPFLPPRRIHHHRRLHLHLHRLRRLRCHDAGDGGARGEVSLGSERWGIESLVIWSLMYFVHLCLFFLYALEHLSIRIQILYYVSVSQRWHPRMSPSRSLPRNLKND